MVSVWDLFSSFSFPLSVSDNNFLALCRLKITSLNKYRLYRVGSGLEWAQDVRRHQNHNLLLYIFSDSSLYLWSVSDCRQSSKHLFRCLFLSFFICFAIRSKALLFNYISEPIRGTVHVWRSRLFCFSGRSSVIKTRTKSLFLPFICNGYQMIIDIASMQKSGPTLCSRPQLHPKVVCL